MEPWNGEQLERTCADSRSLINEARKSCEDTARHIEQSRATVARSLDLLLRRYYGFGGD